VKSANVLEVVELGRDLFVKHIVRQPIKDHVITAILSLLRIERDGFVINRSAVTNCVDALLQLSDNADGISVYTRYLEPEILRLSDAYYKAEAERLLETCDTPEYLRRVYAISLFLVRLGLLNSTFAFSGQGPLFRGRVTRTSVSVLTNIGPPSDYSSEYSPRTTFTTTH
jgi:hypothetical protein